MVMGQLRKASPSARPVASTDLRSQRFAELEAAYRQQLRALRVVLTSAREKQMKRGSKA